MTLTTGATLGGRYTLGAAIASGGMGDVWEAVDEVLGRSVAVKVMRPQGAEHEAFLERFRDEARGSASLHHPNIASVFDYGEEDGTAYLVMELVPGRTLGEIIRDSDGGMPSDQVRSVLGQAALALSAAHAAGVVHRDVKPANIIVTPEGQAKLTDFGIARLGDGSGHTLTGEVLGTPDYISPEQALGEPATAASDIYSLGVVAHEMITGRKPFDMGTPVATAIAQVNTAAPALPDTVPVDLREVVDACLAKSAADRPVDARTVALAADATTGPAPAAAPAAAPVSATHATTPLPAAPVGATRALPVARTGRTAGATTDTTTVTTTGATTGATTGRRRSRRLAWVAVPAVLLLAGGGYAVGTTLGGPADTPDARPTAPAVPVAATTQAATTTPAASRTTAATPTRSARTVATAAPAQVSQGGPVGKGGPGTDGTKAGKGGKGDTQPPAGPGKDRGKGKAK